ncbi:GNAT family N-acetyltransferase [Dongshaea marina]|uniref:GNAT family N-acetyltransferase n=1 Tax=Dongshaea marina TaxID=2047966 RepID=UPI000D3EC745|nr:GNAT family N-acetyltransferase [Dongshaea marina]
MYEIIEFDSRYINLFYESFRSIVHEHRFYIITQAPSYECVKQWCERNVQEKSLHLIALGMERLIGSADIYSRQHEGASHIGVLAMFVIQEYRGHGVATQLMESIIGAARLRGFEKLELEVLASNRAAITLYHKFGFFEEGVRSKAKKVADGHYIDVILMAKNLDDCR